MSVIKLILFVDEDKEFVLTAVTDKMNGYNISIYIAIIFILIKNFTGI
jgi:hypothetical protein